ncbi:MAG: flagellar export chaperone FliS [Dethiobacter sp.]|jgi:flagellar protein FliS|nr:flagellar export chaperone FliS [Dethiobacter sp.]MBS3902168.1 flagellar export chaperone FliS [Dethiobacter sp.]MBS3989677.1 flagellar export chaperone FliS [Dethiobacter sp.]
MLANPYRTYLHTQIETASGLKLIIMLYNAAIKFTKLAQMGLAENKLEQSHINNVKTQDILFELMNALDPNQGEMADSLYLLYDYMQQRLVTANLKKEAAPLAEVESLLVDLRDTWLQAFNLTQ